MAAEGRIEVEAQVDEGHLERDNARRSGRSEKRLSGVRGRSASREPKIGGGRTEGDQDMSELPKNNLWIVMPAIGLVLFLAALDISIVATALPTIAEDLGATPSEYSWVGTAYLLSATVMTPINGRVSDIIGRKPMVYGAILCFTVFSALCGASKSMTWLIVARAFQGLGGGGIIGLTNILISDIVPLHKRGLMLGALGGVWGIASCFGPVIGGLLTEKASWRWTFYINLPTCAISFVLLLLTLKLNPTKKRSFAELRQTFDFLGMGLVIVGAALLVVGFAEAADFGFDKPLAYGVITAGAALMVGAIINCLITKRVAIIPGRMFRNRTTLLFLLGSLLHATAFIQSNFLLPQMFQGVRGATPLSSGVQLVPYSVIVSIGTIIAGLINSKLRITRPVIWFGYASAGLGFAMFYGFFRHPFSIALQEGLLAMAGLGVGLSLQLPMLVLQAAMPMKDMAAVTSAWTLTRNLGGSIGLAIFTAILNTDIRRRFVEIPGYGTDFQAPDSAADYRSLQALPEGPMKTAVLYAFSRSLGLCYIIASGMFFGALVLTIWTKSYSLNRAVGNAAARAEEGNAGAGETATSMDGEVTGGDEKLDSPGSASPTSLAAPTDVLQVEERAASELTAVEMPSRDHSPEKKAM